MTPEEIKIANATYRSKGSSVFDKDGNIRSVVAKYIANNISKDKKILDFGCGTEFIQGKYLKSVGFDVDGWDFGSNKPENCVENLEKVYDVVYASNVLNVISSESMLIETLEQINGCLKDGGIFVANYPSSPRKMELSAKQIKDIIESELWFASNIGGITSAPVWIFSKSSTGEKRKEIVA